MDKNQCFLVVCRLLSIAQARAKKNRLAYMRIQRTGRGRWVIGLHYTELQRLLCCFARHRVNAYFSVGVSQEVTYEEAHSRVRNQVEMVNQNHRRC